MENFNFLAVNKYRMQAHIHESMVINNGLIQFCMVLLWFFLFFPFKNDNGTSRTFHC